MIRKGEPTVHLNVREEEKKRFGAGMMFYPEAHVHSAKDP